MFDEIREFGKPWPYIGVRTLAAGSWRAGSREGTIELSIDDDGVPVFVVTDSAPHSNAHRIGAEPPIALDEAWLLRRISDLTGVPLVAEDGPPPT
jgi:hypothetical protein